MNIQKLSDKLIHRDLIVKNTLFEKTISNYCNEGFELLSLFNIKYSQFNSNFSLFYLPKNLYFKQIVLDEKFEKIIYEDESVHSIYVNFSFQLFVGNLIIDEIDYNVFLQNKSSIIYLVKKEMINSYINNVLIYNNHSISENDFKFLKKDLESISNQFIFYLIEEKE